ncbi:hypothetical protein CIL05_16075 [Virgibacillus profundi]|uniref:Spo0E family sporulation regulatory protein-aspartic acid phosphatase n=1 Tax=Virgibacillus profundi TaxID=2024555 RepID=A0A2A2IBD2_9BACI|nr:aspartyl-phosphate phosphatase Spo0E family protein [Virgibacillus profundi]PAV28455.1 hypothetical protein CIL05_16075 [Virgibacillus profundi]PXY52628.1 aspartyl-phosphate phosphatase Spo0E family protein [Virgibacillus profundi]
MGPENTLENQIEQLRNKMYKAFEDKGDYDDIIKISQKLDGLLNQLEYLNNQKNKV